MELKTRCYECKKEFILTDKQKIIFGVSFCNACYENSIAEDEAFNEMEKRK
jgi:hypothetical protein